MIYKQKPPDQEPPGKGDFVPEGWEPYTERDKIIEWRTEQLVRAGVPVLEAEKLAYGDADLHVMLDAAGKIPPEKMLDIFT